MTKEKREQIIRITIAGVLVLGVGVISVLQFRSHLYGTFSRALERASQKASAGLGGEDALSILKNNTDTDQDGLADVQELRIYNTSPYLQDSDSDGVFDGDEVKAGSDPNCPKGEECGKAPAPAEAKFPLLKDEVLKVEEPKTEQEQIKISDLPTDLTPDEIRETLKKQGVPDSILGRMDDKTLKEIYDETISELKGKEELFEPESLNSFAAPSKEQLEFIKKLSPQALRTLLEQTIGENEQLSKLSDEQLKEAFDSIISQYTE